MANKVASLIIRLTDDVSGPAAKAAGALRSLGHAGDGLSRLKTAAAGLDHLGARLRRARAEVEATAKELAAAQRKVDFFARSKAANSPNYAAFKASGEVDAAQARLRAAKTAASAAERAHASLRATFEADKAGARALAASLKGVQGAEDGVAAAAQSANAALARQPALMRQAAQGAAQLGRATHDMAARMGESHQAQMRADAASRRISAGMGAAGRSAADAQATREAERAKAAQVALERAETRREAAKTLASLGGLALGHKVNEGTHAVLHTYREFDKERRFGKAVMGLTDEEQKPLVEQAIHMGATTKYNDVQVLEAQRELAARGLKKDQVMGLMSPAADLGQSLDLKLPDAVKQMEGAIFGFQKPIGTLAEAMASARQTADAQVKAAKISGMTPEDISQAYKYGATPARMAGLSEQTLLAFASISKKANMGGDESGTAFRALVANALSPTRKAKEAMLANGLDYKNYQRNPDKIDTAAFVKTVAAQYGVKLNKKTTGGLDSIFTNQGMIADPSKFTPAVMKLLSDNLGGDDAKSKKSIAGLANRFRDASMKGVDTDRLVQDLMKKIPENPAIANAIFGSKQGARIANALGNPAEFKHMLEELLSHSGGYAEKIAKERMAGYDGAMSRLEGATKNLETAFGRAWDQDGSGGFLTGLTDMAAKVVQGLAELPPAALQAVSAVAWLTGKIATGAGTLGLLGAALSLKGSASALTIAAGRLGAGGALGAGVGAVGNAAAGVGGAAAGIGVAGAATAAALGAGAAVAAYATADQLPKVLAKDGPTAIDPATGGVIDANPMAGLGEALRAWWKGEGPKADAAPDASRKLGEAAREALAGQAAARAAAAAMRDGSDGEGRRGRAMQRAAETARTAPAAAAERARAGALQSVNTLDPAVLERARRGAVEFRSDPEGKRGREMLRRDAAEAARPAPAPAAPAGPDPSAKISEAAREARALAATPIAPQVDASQVESLGQKSSEAHDKLSGLNTTVTPVVDSGSLSAALAIVQRLTAELAKIGPAIASAKAQATSLSVPSVGQGGGGSGGGQQASTGAVRRGLANNFA